MPDPVVRRLGRDNPFYGCATPRLKTQLFDLVHEMDVRPMHKSLTLGQLVAWVMNELPRIAPDDPRTQTAYDLAGVLWEHSQD